MSKFFIDILFSFKIEKVSLTASKLDIVKYRQHILFLKNVLSILLSVSNVIISKIHAVSPKTYCPYPIAIPIQAVAHIPAAVVNPLIPLEFFNIAPAPKKPIPERTCAGSLAGSRLVYALYKTNNCIDVIEVTQDPSATSI